MKFNRLEIKNIASIGDATISFDEQPLASEPLFLICGDTGSGKSTILDAICLALYATAPRLEGYGNESYEDKKLNMAGSDDNVRISNPCQLVRRNTGEAYARLTFTGNDGHCYTASWHATRGTKKKLDVKLKAESTLYCHADGTTINKRVAEEVARPQIVGLKFEEFCRTTLLAQGGFTRFLNSKSNEKSDILEKLTGTEIYSRLSRQIYRTYSEKNSVYEEKKATLERYCLMSPEEREEKNRLIKEREQEIIALKKQDATLERKIQWMQSLQECHEKIKQGEEQLRNAHEMASQPSVKENEKIISDWNATEEVRPKYSLMANLEQEREHSKREALRLNDEFQRLTADTNSLLQNCTEQQKQLAAIEQQIASVHSEIPMYENASTLITKMKEIMRTQEEKRRNAIDLQEKSNRLSQSKEKLDALYHERQRQEALLAPKRERSAQIEKELSMMPSTEQLNNAKAELEKPSNLLKDIKRVATSLQSMLARRSQQESEHKKAEEHYSISEKELGNAKNTLKQKEELYTAMHLRIDDHAKALRAKLKEGDTCPICGETITTLLHDDEIMELLRPITEERDKASDIREKCETAFNNAAASLKAIKELMKESDKQIEESRSNQAKYAAELKEICMGLAIDTDEIEAIEKIIEERNNDIASKQQARDKMAKLALDASREIDSIVSELNKTNAEYTLKFGECEKLKAAIETLGKQQRNLDEATAKTTAEIESDILIDNWQQQLQQSIDELNKRTTAYNSNKENANNLKLQITEKQGLYTRIKAHSDRIATIFPAWEKGGGASGKANPLLEENWIELSRNCSVQKSNAERIENEIGECNRFISNYHSSNDIDSERVKMLCSISSDTIANLQKQVNSLHRNVENATAVVAEWKKRENELMQNAPTIEDGETVQQLAMQRHAIEEHYSEAAKQVGALNNEIAQDEEERKKRNKEQTELQSLESEASRWKRLSDIFGSAEGGKFKLIAQSYILKQLLENANHYLQQFTSRYDFVAQPGSLIILLVDHNDGDTLRAANTLSGGESFMVSLALALGLSSLNSNNLTPDTLFIDEGFGTLSGNCLNTVIETLEVLHSIGNRRVGIISHLSVLYERITTRIEVKNRTGVSDVTIVG